MVLAYSVINKCIGDDTKAAAHQTQSALKKTKKTRNKYASIPRGNAIPAGPLSDF